MNKSLEEKLFESNCELWSKTYPKEGFFLNFQKDRDWEWSQTIKGEVNAFSQQLQFYLHSQQGAQEEADQAFNKLQLRGCRVLFLYGIGLGYAFLSALDWLKKDRKRELVFIEDDLKVIALGMHTALFQQILRHPQVRITYFNHNHELEKELFDQLFWIHAGSKLAYSALPSYAEKHAKSWEEIQQRLSYNTSIKSALLDEYLHYGIGFYRNFFPNLLKLPEASWGEHLYGQFTGIPAIICGAGPSLARVQPFLKDLENRAVLFAGGSSLNTLASNSILPHFAAGIDPNTSQIRRLQHSKAYEVPFFYRNRIFYHALKSVQGPLVYIPGAGGYTTADWVEEKLELNGLQIDEGHNVVNFCIQIAYLLGCSPIYVVGVDLALTGGAYYAPGLNHTSAPDIYNKKGNFEPEQDDFTTHVDIFGNPVTTRWCWIAESKWIGDFALEHSEIPIINATGGGLGFPGVNNIEPESLPQIVPPLNRDLRGLIHTLVTESKLNFVTKDKIMTLLIELRESLKRCIANLDILKGDGEVQLTKLKTLKAIPDILQSGKAALAESELIEEPAYMGLLDSFNIIYSKLLNQNLKLMKRRHFSPVQKKVKELNLNQKLLEFLRNTARANLALVSWTIDNSQEGIEDESKSN